MSNAGASARAILRHRWRNLLPAAGANPSAAANNSRATDPEMTPKIFALCVPLMAIAACSHTYDVRSSDRATDGPLLQRGASILTGLPLDGYDEHYAYYDSGQLTTDAIVAALRPFTEAVETAEMPETREEYEARAREASLRYVLFPEIMIWKDRDTRRWGLPDLMEVRLTLADAGTGEILDTTTISGTSRTGLSWNDRPEDLLRAPLERYASSLFEDR